MKAITKYIRAGFFGLVILFFFLPFVLVSCPNNNTAVPVSGFELSFGAVKSIRTFGDNYETRRIGLHWQALAALICAGAGIVLSFLKPKPAFFLCLAAGAAGIVFLILLKSQIAIEGAQYVREGYRLYYASGFWTAIVGFSLALLITLIFNPYTKFDIPIKGRSRRSRRR